MCCVIMKKYLTIMKEFLGKNIEHEYVCFDIVECKIKDSEL